MIVVPLSKATNPNPIEMMFQRLMFQARANAFERCTVTITCKDGSILQERAAVPAAPEEE